MQLKLNYYSPNVFSNRLYATEQPLFSEIVCVDYVPYKFPFWKGLYLFSPHNQKSIEKVKSLLSEGYGIGDYFSLREKPYSAIVQYGKELDVKYQFRLLYENDFDIYELLNVYVPDYFTILYRQWILGWGGNFFDSIFQHNIPYLMERVGKTGKKVA